MECERVGCGSEADGARPAQYDDGFFIIGMFQDLLIMP